MTREPEHVRRARERTRARVQRNGQRDIPPDQYPEAQRGDVSLESEHPGDPEPEPSGPGVAPSSFELTPWPEPPAAEAYHGLAGDVVHTIEPETEADPVAILAQFLTAFGSVVGRSAYYQVGAKRHYANTYMVLVGRTAKGRKGTAWSWVEALFGGAADATWVNECIMCGLSSGEGLINCVRDPVSKNGVFVDEGAKDKRLLVVEEEFASVLRQASRDGNILSAILRQAWDSDRLRTMTRNNPLRATGVHMAIIGHVTKSELVKCLSETDAGNGFANRFLWLCATRSKMLPDGGDQLNLAPLQSRVKDAIGHASSVGRMSRSAACQQLWRERYAGLSQELPGILGLVTNRAEAQVLRLSVVYALLDESDVIEVEHLRAALALWGYCLRSCRYIYGESTGDKAADELLDTLRATAGGMALREVFDFFGRHKSAAQLKQILGLLLEHGLVRSEKVGTGGRPAERWYAVTECEQSEHSEQSHAPRT